MSSSRRVSGWSTGPQSLDHPTYLVVVGLAVGQALPLVVTVAIERLLALAGAATVLILVLMSDNSPWRRQSARRASASPGPSQPAPLSVAWKRSKSRRFSCIRQGQS